MFCKQCGKPIDDGQELCADCKANQSTQGSSNAQSQTMNANVNAGNANYNPAAKSKMAAGLLGIFLGSLGVHNFYLGYTGKAVAQLLMTLLSFLTCGLTAVGAWVWGLIEGIMILTGSINTDAQGVQLKD